MPTYVFLFIAGDYYSGPPGDLDQEPDEDWVKSRQNEGRAYQEWDEDADVDESGEDLAEMELETSVHIRKYVVRVTQRSTVVIVLSSGTFLGQRQVGG